MNELQQIISVYYLTVIYIYIYIYIYICIWREACLKMLMQDLVFVLVHVEEEN